MLDLVTHDDAVPRLPAVSVAGGRPLTYGDLADLVDAVGPGLRHDRKALVLCGDLPTLLAYLAGLRLGHTVLFMPASAELPSAYQPEFVVPAPGGEAGLCALGYLPGEDVTAGVRPGAHGGTTGTGNRRGLRRRRRVPVRRG